MQEQWDIVEIISLLYVQSGGLKKCRIKAVFSF